MPLFARNKEREVQGLMVSLANNDCSELKELMDGPRLEGRVRLCVVALVIPVEQGKLKLDEMFPAVTKEVSSTGVSLIAHLPKPLNNAVLAFRIDVGMKFVRAEAKHFHRMGAGFYQIGMKMSEVIHASNHAGLATVTY